MTKRVFSVGRAIPGNAAEEVSFRSDKSLFDADVILFWPTFKEYSAHEEYAGKRLVSPSSSADLKRDCEHWRTEIKNALLAGKVVFVFLTKPVDVYYYTGSKSFSGTGRSQVTTNHVAPANSYDCLPVSPEGLMPRGGNEIAITGSLGELAPYWNEFKDDSEYEVYFDAKGFTPILGTKKGEKTVGAIYRTKGSGVLVLLPPVQWDDDAFTYEKGPSRYWKKEGIAYGKKLVSALVSASEALRKEGRRTPPPEWAADESYVLAVERSTKLELAKLDEQVKKLADQRAKLEAERDDATALRDLLFETGKPLEQAILKALSALGFEASGFSDGESEFDAVFSAPEGRFLGEAEGKDSKAINIDKMSQLERNLQEDFAREGVTEFAKGVLFGNAYRLEPPKDRKEFFTDKCVTAAKRLKVALVRTTDLFTPAQYLTNKKDPEYSARSLSG